MNKEEFERLVRPYLIKTQGQRNKINTELVLRDFKHPLLPTKHYYMATVSELNKLIYIPTFGQQYLIFSDESTMYIYHPSGVRDEWYETEKGTGWSDRHQWVMRGVSITSMNDGKGWNVGEDVDTVYYALKPHLNSIKYLNWTVEKNPFNLK